MIRTAHATILVADGDSEFRSMLRTYLSSFGHHVVEAENGKVATELIEHHSPDLILMDAIMPVMTGLEAATIIKRHFDDHFVPIIFITALQDEASLSKCLESGGDDFLVKPVNWLLLHSKMLSMLRIRQMQKKLHDFQHRTAKEIELSQHIFDKLTHRMSLQNISGLEQWIHSAGNFCGDLMLFDRSPSGKLYLMLGDFTGHGLSAAIGALPTSDIFFAMSQRDCNLADILTEINGKLHEAMPIGHFCAAVFLCFDPATRRVEIVNAGLPPVLALDAAGNINTCVSSSHVALGVLPVSQFSATISSFQDLENNTFVIYSDGVTEATNHAGEMFGMERLHAALCKGRNIVDSIKTAVQKFIGNHPPDDDISLVTLRL
jgi:serine phosphatase RsbU (regulator of sigma subunit)